MSPSLDKAISNNADLQMKPIDKSRGRLMYKFGNRLELSILTEVAQIGDEGRRELEGAFTISELCQCSGGVGRVRGQLRTDLLTQRLSWS